ncbi:Hypothetical protein SMB2099_4425 [Serratia marcescens SMB2099]|nr:Hypothetical protein SMB2099_4425 [Serratia marcescens SMB2099]
MNGWNLKIRPPPQKMMQKSLTRRHASCIIPPAGKRGG